MAEQLLEGPRPMLSDDRATCRLDLALVLVVGGGLGTWTSLTSLNHMDLRIGSVSHG